MTHDNNPADERWRAVIERSSAADGRFVYAVLTTGIYCRPSCRARHPLRENVAFYETGGDAEAAGFRACLRCRPGELGLEAQQAEQIAAVCRALRRSDEPVPVAELASQLGWSVSHFHRVFRRVTGITPKAWMANERAERLRNGLQSAPSVTAAMFDAGYNSSGRFYEESTTVLGMTPSAYRAKGQAETIRFALGESSLGSVLVAATERGVCAVALGDDPEQLVVDLQKRFKHAELVGADGGFEAMIATVVGLVDAPAATVAAGAGPDSLPLDVRGTAFQLEVWNALRAIPLGETRTYAEIARAIGQPTASRAVAGACGANPVAVCIPCHRVVRSDGGISGYRWGVDRKRALLLKEGAR